MGGKIPFCFVFFFYSFFSLTFVDWQDQVSRIPRIAQESKLKSIKYTLRGLQTRKAFR